MWPWFNSFLKTAASAFYQILNCPHWHVLTWAPTLLYVKCYWIAFK